MLAVGVNASAPATKATCAASPSPRRRAWQRRAEGFSPTAGVMPSRISALAATLKDELDQPFVRCRWIVLHTGNLKWAKPNNTSLELALWGRTQSLETHWLDGDDASNTHGPCD